MKEKFYIKKTNQIGKNSNIRQLPNGDVVEIYDVKSPNGESSTIEVNLTEFHKDYSSEIPPIFSDDVTNFLVHTYFDHPGKLMRIKI